MRQEKENTTCLSMHNMHTYLHNDMQQDLQTFTSDVNPGYTNIDDLYTGLYVIGGSSGIGKTTFMHQMADQMAKTGPVLYITLEQSALELASKSLSRIMAKQDFVTAMTALQIRKNGNDPRVSKAIAVYDSFADNLSIADCTYRATIENIENTVYAYMKQTGKKPVVIVDYLQVIQSAENRMTTKEVTDMNVQRLKQLQSDNKLIMIVISSLNRQNYMTQIDYDSFKESGGIEYTADVLWGLQLEVLHNDIFDKPGRINEKRQLIINAKLSNPRQIEFVCLKNRYGLSNYSCLYNYYPQYDYFYPFNIAQ